jgi:cardiolipin synthase
MNPLEALASQSFCRVAEARQSNGNQVRLLRDGPEVFPAWLAAINAGQSTVWLENYIIQEDAVGEKFAEALKAAAGRGVKCRVLYDWLGCLTRTSAKFWRALRDAGVEVRRYNAPQLSNPLRWISRDHRKVLCVDGEIVFTGGLCIGHDWLGDPARAIPPWRDTAIEIRGPAVADVCAAFLDSWEAAGAAPAGAAPAGAAASGEKTLPPPACGEVDVSVIAGRPNSMGLYRLEQLVAEIAETSLWLTDGYFVATTVYVRALTGAARAGVDVRLLVPGSSNWPVVGALSQSAYRPLLQAGVRVFEWNGPMLHAKTAVADGCWTRIGSSNSNLASWVSNRELDVTIKDADLAAQMMALYEADIGNSTEVVLRSGRLGLAKPVSSGTQKYRRSRQTSAGRLLSGAIGFGSTLGASFSQRRTLGRADSLIISGGGFLVLLLGLIGVFAPRVLAWPLAAIAIWTAFGLLSHGLKLWRSDG